MDRNSFVKQYFNFCNEVGEKPEDVLVSAGGALLLLGLREESSDLDLDVRREVYDKFKRHGNIRRSSLGEYVDYNELVSLHVTPSGIGKMEVDGVWMYSVGELMVQKMALANMPDRTPGKAVKDLKDIEQLKSL